MISLSAPVYDENGNIIVEELLSSEFHRCARRVTKTRTLDLDVAIEDRGYTDKDRSFSIHIQSDEVLRDILQRFIANYSTLVLVVPEGWFIVVPMDFDLSLEKFTLLFEVV